MVNDAYCVGRGFAQVPNLNWNRINSKAYLNSWESGNVNRNYAAPSLQGLLEIDFSQPPSMRPISEIRESSCW